MEIIFGDWSIGIIMEVLLCKTKKQKKQKIANLTVDVYENEPIS